MKNYLKKNWTLFLLLGVAIQLSITSHDWLSGILLGVTAFWFYRDLVDWYTDRIIKKLRQQSCDDSFR